MAEKEIKGIKKFLEEFKAFAMRGNVLDMAIGVVIGAAFGKITTSVVNDIIMPLIGLITGGIDLTQWNILLNSAAVEAGADPVTLGIGNLPALGRRGIGQELLQLPHPAEKLRRPGLGFAGVLVAADLTGQLNDGGVMRTDDLGGQRGKGVIAQFFLAAIQRLHPGVPMKKAVRQIP